MDRGVVWFDQVDPDVARINVSNRVQTVRALLPPGVEPSVTLITTPGDREVTLAILGVDDSTAELLPSLAENVVERIQAEHILENVEAVHSETDQTLAVNVDRHACDRLEVATSAIAESLRNVGAGTDLDQVRRITIPAAKGNTVQLSEVAEVTTTPVPKVSYHVNLRPAIRIVGRPLDGSALYDVSQRCLQIAEEVRKSHERENHFRTVDLTR